MLKIFDILCAHSAMLITRSDWSWPAIRDGRLYKADFGTFEEYVEQRWEWKAAQAYRLIDAAQLAERVFSPIGEIPARESHIRPLLERLSAPYQNP